MALSPARRLRAVLVAAALPAALATCDANLVGPAGVDRITLAFLGDTILAVGQVMRPAIEVRDGEALIAAPRLVLGSSDSSIIDITTDGELILRRLGTASVTASLAGALLPATPPSLTQALQVVAESVTVSVSAVTMTAIGSMSTVAATAWDANGQAIVDAPLRWECANPDVASVSQVGVILARGAGSTAVRVTLGPDTATVTVAVNPVVARYHITPEELLLDALGATATLTVVPRDSNGNAIALTPENTPIWVSRDPTTASVTSVGLATARRNSATYIVAHRSGVADSIPVTVSQTATSVVITALAGLAIDALNGELELSAVGFDRNSNADGNSLPAWASLNPVVAQVDPERGVVVGRTIGSAQIVATIDAGADTVLVTVANIPAALELEPATVDMSSVNDTAQLTVRAINSRGAVVPVEVTWRSTDTTTVRIVPGARIEARGVGVSRVIVTAGPLADTATVTVTNDPVTINIGPTNLALTFLNQTASPAVTIRNARGDTLPRSSVTWRSDDAVVATVAGTGTITARGVGTTTIRATSGAIGDSVRVTVTNDPFSIVLAAVRDTITAIGRTVAYTGEVRNEGGAILAGFPIAWQSTIGGVASVSGSGVVTSLGNGTTLVIATAGTVADTITVVVTNPTILWVDNSVVVAERFGTLARPYARIQDAVVAADAADTVVVRRGFGYAESLNLSRRITLLGDSAAYVAGARDPLLLPRIAHDSGTAGITGTTTAQLVIRYFALTHSLDGPAINTSGADVRIEHFYVNPASTTVKIGRGILVRDAPAFAVLADIGVRNVRGYGIRLERVTQGQIDRAVVQGVDSITGTRGAGIDLYRGSLHDVRTSNVRETQGPGVLLDSTSAGSVTDSDLLGRSILVRVRGAATAITVIERNRFDLRVLPGATDIRGSANDGRSGVEVVSSSNVQIRENTFTEVGSAQMDAIRLIAARGGGAFNAVNIYRNRFQGGRFNVRSERSSWTMTESRSDGAVLPVSAADADSLQLVSDTLVGATSDGCVASTGTTARVEINGGVFSGCGSGTIGGRAVRVSGALNTTLTVRNATLGGPNQTAVEFNGRDITLRDNVIVGSGTRTVTGFFAGGVIDAITTTTAVISGNRITDYPGLTGVLIDANGKLTLDSNIVARNRIGAHLLDIASTSAGVDNDFSDHEVAGVVNDAGPTIPITSSWWGAGLGPRPTTPGSVGDSVTAGVDPTAFRTAPFFAGATAAGLRKVRGDGQTALRSTTLPIPLTVRVMDPAGRPVAGVTVTFARTAGNGTMGGLTTRNVTTDASGLAEVTFTLGSSPGINSVRASVSGVAPTVTFTLTGT
jgi:hypothetical protein